MARPGYTYQASSVLYLGQRTNQEDAIATDFAIGEEMGFAVLSDGMGGHNAGEVASKVAVTEVYSELKLQSGRASSFRGNVREILLNAAEMANACIADVANDAPEAHGMGATLVVPVFIGDQLHWLSVGDSPLYIYRARHLRQLNEDHSMAPHIDLMVRSGMLTESGGRDHPDRNCLTSVLVGRPISKIDCPETPTQLFDGDIVIAASDGLQTLSKAEMQDILARHSDDSSDKIAEAFLHEIEMRDDPEQDNVSFAVVKIAKTPARVRSEPLEACDKAKDLVSESGAKAHGRRRLPRLHASLARLLPAASGSID